MKLAFTSFDSIRRARAKRGWALLAVLTISAAAIVVLAGYMAWSNQNSTAVSRRNEYFATAYAAEAATEKALSAIVQDDQEYGEGYVLSRLASYATLVPTVADDPYWANYSFSAGGIPNSLIVSMVTSNMSATLGAPYTGLLSQGFTYEIIANAANVGSMYNIPTTVGQKVVLSQIPMFQFAIFYQDVMEIDNGRDLTVNGLVHGNNNIYLYPDGASLNFLDDVSASGQVLHQMSPLNPQGGNFGNLSFNGTSLSGVNPLELPSGNGTNAMHNGGSILQMPQSSAGPRNTALLYNQVQMIVLVSNNSVTVTSGVANNQATVVPNNQWSSFLTVGLTNFIDQRDNNNPVNAVTLDVGKFGAWNATNTLLGSIDSIYIADLRSTSNAVTVTNTLFTTNIAFVTNVDGSITSLPTITPSNVVTTQYNIGSQPGVVLTNGAQMPSTSGLGVASPDPVYVVGNWNVTTNGTPENLGTGNTSQTYPSAIYADAITVLSSAWQNANSGLPLWRRNATDDTVNAAFFTGNTPSDGADYSGGVENFPRFLENWSGHNFTYNGSMIEAFQSQIANYPWSETGGVQGAGVYNPPVRNWAFDVNFRDPSKLPPLTPRVIYIQRAGWVLLPPGTTHF